MADQPKTSLVDVTVDKLVHGGQGMGVMPDGRKVFVWGALPGEKVRVRVLKSKRSYADGVAEEVVSASPARIEPREANYLATSPWQIVDFTAENGFKKDIVKETFAHAGVDLADFNLTAAGGEWNYRNKMEYSFWGDDSGVHLAQFGRGTHAKAIVTGSALAMPAVDKAANALLDVIRASGVRAGDMKALIVRGSQSGETAASLFVKTESFPKLALPDGMKGLRVHYSNPLSPASVLTRTLYEQGDARLHDMLLGRDFTYDTDSFFQVNLQPFEAALSSIKAHGPDADRLVDMYAGVGSIGLSVARSSVELVELDPATAAMARVNAAAAVGLQATVTEAPAERSLDSIVADAPVSFDPPRAGLHENVVGRLLEVLPPAVIYLSCNPVTQARDLASLQGAYAITYFEGFNFFPHTPHIETLAVMERKP